MATAALPSRRRRSPAWPRIRQHAKALGTRLLTPAKPVLANLASIPLTVAGLGCVDAGVFLASQVAGLIVTGACLMLLERMIADER